MQTTHTHTYRSPSDAGIYLALGCPARRDPRGSLGLACSAACRTRISPHELSVTHKDPLKSRGNACFSGRRVRGSGQRVGAHARGAASGDKRLVWHVCASSRSPNLEPCAVRGRTARVPEATPTHIGADGGGSGRVAHNQFCPSGDRAHADAH